MLTQAEYNDKFSKTDDTKTPFQRHLEVCGIKTKMDKSRRAVKFLWGVNTDPQGKKLPTTCWVPLCELKRGHLNKIKTTLAIKPKSYEDEEVSWVYDLVDHAISFSIHRPE